MPRPSSPRTVAAACRPPDRRLPSTPGAILRRIVRAAAATPSGSSTRATWSGTRSCSSVEVGSAFTTVLFVHAARHRARRGLARLHPRRRRSGSGSRCSSRTSPRRWPRGAARPRRRRSARRARTSAKRSGLDVAGLAATRRARGGVSRARAARRETCVLVEAGEPIPADGEVVEGVASVDESAITGESAPVIRESGGDRSAVTGGTRVLSDWLVVRVTAEPGRDLPRPDDRDGRGGEAAEDARTRSRSTSCSPASPSSSCSRP